MQRAVLGEDVWRALTDASRAAELPLASSEYGMVMSDLIPKSVRTGLAARASNWDIGQNHRLPRERWSRVVDAALEEPWNLGYLLVAEGGLVALASSLEIPKGTLSKNFDTWSEHGLIKHFYGPGGRSRPPLVAVELPLLNEHLVWFARGMFRTRAQFKGAITIKQLYYLLWNAVERQRIPYAVETRAQAEQVISDLKAGRQPKA